MVWKVSVQFCQAQQLKLHICCPVGPNGRKSGSRARFAHSVSFVLWNGVCLCLVLNERRAFRVVQQLRCAGQMCDEGTRRVGHMPRDHSKLLRRTGQDGVCALAVLTGWAACSMASVVIRPLGKKHVGHVCVVTDVPECVVSSQEVITAVPAWIHFCERPSMA